MLEEGILWRYILVVAIFATFYTSNVFINILRLLYIVLGYVTVTILWAFITWIYDQSLEGKVVNNPNCGLPGTLFYMDNRDLLNPSIIHTESKLLDESLEQILLLFIKDFILNWYKTQFTDITFPKIVYQNICLVVNRIYDRIKVVNWTPVFAIKINSVFALHVSLFMRTLKKIDESKESSSYNYKKIINEFFNIETKIENISSHKTICTNSKIEIEYLSFLTETIMFLLFPENIFDDTTTRYFIRDILVIKTLLPAINYLCDSDTINKFIHTYRSDTNYTYDNFINAVRMNTSYDDLVELLKNINSEITKLSGNDMNNRGDEDLTKKQITSLTFVKRLILIQIDNLKAGQKLEGSNFYYDSKFNKPTSSQSSHGDSSSSLLTVQVKLPEVPVRNMIDNSIAFPYLSDYINELGDIQILFLYVNIHSILSSHKSLLESDAYKKKAIFFNDERLLGLRRDIVALIQDYKEHFEQNNKLKEIPQKFYETILSEAELTIPSVETLRKLRDILIQTLETASYIGPFYASNRYKKMCVELGLISNTETKHKSHTSSSTKIVLNPNLFSSNVIVSPTIIDTFIVTEMPDQFIAYAIEVTITESDNKNIWVIPRRYRDFCELHDILTSKFPVFSTFSFPEKKIFKNNLQENINKRKDGLNLFLKNITDHELFHSSKTCFDLIVSFFDEEAWSETRSRIFHKNRVSPNIQISETTESSYGDFETSTKNHVGLNYSKFKDKLTDNEDIEAFALSILLNLVEELFDVRNKTPWLARQIKTIFMDIFIAAVGDKLGRKIVDQIDYLFSTEKIIDYLNTLRETFWPANVWSDAPYSRSPEIQSRDRIIASSILIGMIPSELRRYLGDEVSLDGINRLFNLLQIQQLNKRLFYSLIEALLEEIFPENSYKETFKSLTEFYATC